MNDDFEIRVFHGGKWYDDTCNLKIEHQGAEFVRALIPHLPTTRYLWKAAHLWRLVTAHRGHPPTTPRESPEEWLTYRDGDIESYAFVAGAETAIREYEATL